jgi:hypothetical protein
MRKQWLVTAAALSMTGCSYGDMLDTIPADRHQPYVPSLSRQAVRITASPAEQRFLHAEGCQHCKAADQFYRFIHDDPAVRKSRLPATRYWPTMLVMQSGSGWMKHGLPSISPAHPAG